jgi:ribose/xylose/arabinose/galactoside ABC-type transport system permease subunit
MTYVIISGGIDLSVGSMLAFSGMTGAVTMIAVGGEDPRGIALFIGTIVGIFAGLCCGFLNGALITKLKLPPFIVTLGTMSAFRGISYVMNDGQPYNVPGYKYLGEGVVFGVPVSVLIFILIVAVAGFLLRYTRLGRYTYAIGSNREAAFHAGVSVDRNLIYIYSLTGLFVGIAAMIATSRTVSAQPTAGIALELDIIAAVVIGGASLSGGRGTITGTIIGALLISFLRNGCTLLGISTNVQLIVIGAIIIAAVAVDQLARSKAEAVQDTN